MQVGLTIPELSDQHAFLRASYVFVLFSIVSVVAVLALVGVVFVVTFFFNMVAAIRHADREQRERKKLAEAKSGKEA
jgi:uncharacterized membrane protein